MVFSISVDGLHAPTAPIPKFIAGKLLLASFLLSVPTLAITQLTAAILGFTYRRRAAYRISMIAYAIFAGTVLIVLALCR